MTRKVGDSITLLGTGIYSKGVECIVTQVSVQDGRILELRAVTPDELLCKVGFIERGGEYYVTEWDICHN